MIKKDWQKPFDIEENAVRATRDIMDEAAFERAVVALSGAERIGTTGCGHSGICCTHFAHLLCCIERPARFISPAEAIHGAMGYMQRGDVLVWASRGGKTDELTPILDICKKKGVTVIGVTENTASPLALSSDIVLPISVPMECDKYNSQGTASFTATAAVFHALQAAVLEETGYKNEQFAIIHPGGAVGKRLNG